MIINMIIRIKNIFLFLGIVNLFVFGQIQINDKEIVYSIWEIIIIEILLFGTQYLIFSTYGYNSLSENNLKINYSFYQFIGMVWAISSSVLVTLALVGCCLEN